MRAKIMVIIVLFTLLFVTVFMSSCDNVNAIYQIDSDTIHTKIESHTSSNNTQEFTSEDEIQDQIINVDPVMLNFESKQDYDDYINSHTLPDNFITYDMLKELGEFDAVVFLTYPEFSQTFYTFIDELGCELNLYVETRVERQTFDTDKENYTLVDNIESIDMRYIENLPEGTSLYYYGDLRYTYISGKLISIMWIYDGIEYTLCGTSGLFNYPNIQTTISGKLMNQEQANSALEDFLNSMNE